MHILEIWRYPIASLAGEAVHETFIDETGVVGDRAYSLVCEQSGEVASPEGVARWQAAPLAAARGNATDLSVRTPSTGWLKAFDPASKAALDEHFGFSVALRRTGPWRSSVPIPETVQPRYPRRPLHIVSRRMMNELQNAVPACEISARRFRANLVLDVNQEDELGTFSPNAVLRFGDVQIRVLEGTFRCGFVALAQDDVDRSAEALKIIKREHGMVFGVYAEVVRGGRVEIGSAGERA